MRKMVVFCLSALLTVCAHAYSPRFDTLVVFGDSLSDNGNLYRYLLHFLPVSPPYYEGHFSDGPVWVEYLYESYFPSEYAQGLQNYAVGGAGAILSYKENLPYTLTFELDNYLYWHTYDHQQSSLYSIWIGANNYINEPTNVEDLTSSVILSIGGVIERLIRNGGDKFLITNLPDLAQLPQAKDSPNQALLTRLSMTHNEKLTQLVNELRDKYPDVLFINFDVNQFFEESRMNAAEYGVDNLVDPCYLGSYSGWLLSLMPNEETLHASLQQQIPELNEQQWLMIKNNPQLHEAAVTGYIFSLLPKNEPLQCANYLYWDHVHPTTAVHQLIAKKVKTLIDEAGLQPFWPQTFTKGQIDGRRANKQVAEETRRGLFTENRCATGGFAPLCTG